MLLPRSCSWLVGGRSLPAFQSIICVSYPIIIHLFYIQQLWSGAGGAPGVLAGCVTGSDRLQSTGSALAPLKGNSHTSGFVCVYSIKTPFLSCIMISILLTMFLYYLCFCKVSTGRFAMGFKAFWKCSSVIGMSQVRGFSFLPVLLGSEWSWAELTRTQKNLGLP